MIRRAAVDPEEVSDVVRDLRERIESLSKTIEWLKAEVAELREQIAEGYTDEYPLSQRCCSVHSIFNCGLCQLPVQPGEEP